MLVTSWELRGPASHGGSASCGMIRCVEEAAMGVQSLLGLWCLGCAGDGDELAASPGTEAGVLQRAQELELEVAGLLDCNDALPSSAYESLRTRLAEESLRQAFVRTMSQYAFCAAAESGNIELLRIAIDSGVRPDAVRTSAGETPLICAARRGQTDAVQMLLDSGASVHRRGSSKIITRSGTADFSAITYSMTALHVAVDGNYQRCARLLIDRGARVDSRFRSGFNHAGYSALDLAALRGNIECLRLLIDHGANVGSFGGSFRRTALHHAVIEDQRGCMRVLLDRGANREARDLDGWTPLGLAAMHGRVDAARLLIDREAKIDSSSKLSSTSKFQAPLFAATIIGGDGQLECMRLLLDRGAKINALTSETVGGLPGDRRTSLQSATMRGKFACALLLVERGAAIDGELFLIARPPIRIILKRNVAEALRTFSSRRREVLQAMDENSDETLESACSSCIHSIRRGLRRGEFSEAHVKIVITAVQAKRCEAHARILEARAPKVSQASARTPSDRFLCPISLSIMRDPVRATDGYTYERNEIEAWFAIRGTSPMTRALIDRKLVPDGRRAAEIEEWRSRDPDREKLDELRPM